MIRGTGAVARRGDARAVTRAGMLRGWTLRALLGMACLSCGLRALAGLPGEEPLAIKDAIGRGAHAFFGGDFERAYDEFTGAIEAGSADPRAFYFRGLSALRLGRTAEAETDLAAGADREAADGSTLRISRALQRVQGCDRLALERFRKRARLAVLQRDQEAAARRYSSIEDPSAGPLRRRRPEDIDEELLVPRRADDVEEVPAPSPSRPRGRSRLPFGDDVDAPSDAAPQSEPPDATEETEKDMASEPDEKTADDAAADDAAGR